MFRSSDGRGVSATTLLFAVTLLVSSSLLFVVEPMFAKMVLPLLGGTPAVWNTCVVFFQATMLAGYGYAHLTSRRLRLFPQVVLHAALMLATAFLLPVVIPDDWIPPPEGTPIPSLLGLLGVVLGAPFLIVSSTAPLLQRWYSRTDEPSAHDPYFLYAASNLGSMAALLGYPLVIEPLWTLPGQSAGWTTGYVVCTVLVAGCGWLAWRRQSVPGEAATAQAPAGRISWPDRLRWLVLAAVPSSLMLGVTTFVTTDVAAIPLLWTVPLALYLFTFVNAFSARPLVPIVLARGAMIALTLPLVLLAVVAISSPAWLFLPLHMLGFLACALVLHGELARRRPDANRLTEFYLWVSVGGLVGGAFNTLVAPLIFNGILEYPLGFALAWALRPARARQKAERPAVGAADVAAPLAFGAAALVLLGTFSGRAASLVEAAPVLGLAAVSLSSGVMAVAYVASTRRPLRMALGLVMVVVAGLWFVPGGGRVLHTERTFFGVLRVVFDPERNAHRLMHGSTMHGEESLDIDRRGQAMSYYHPTGPIGQVLGTLADRLRHVAVVGLGAGSLAAYARPGEEWTFFEIDPAVERLARDTRYFSFLDTCGDRCRVVLGDARLTLGAMTTARFDAIVLDAFSSDAIPTHLVTRQAFELYLDRLGDDGVLALHISNRHLRLEPLLGATALELGLVARAQFDVRAGEPDARSSNWLVMARSPDALGALGADARWRPAEAGTMAVWTDDYSNLLSVFEAPRLGLP